MRKAELAEALGIAKRALSFYAKRSSWRPDDWNVLAVIQPPDYGDPGAKARRALERVGRIESKVTARGHR